MRSTQCVFDLNREDSDFCAKSTTNNNNNDDGQVAEILPDGTKILKDGTRIHPDGSVTLKDGSNLSAEQARALALKRKKRRETIEKEGADNALKRKDGETDAEFKTRMRNAGFDENEISASLAFEDS